MNRCTPRLLAALLLAALSSLVATLPLSAGAQTEAAQALPRAFPEAALRAEMVVQNHPLIVLNGKSEQLSPGARIFDKDNYLVLSGRLVNQALLVNYLRDSGGQIHQVWILTAEEARQKRDGAGGTTFNFSSGNPTAKP